MWSMRKARLIAHPDISLVLRNTDLSRLAQVQAARAAGSGSEATEQLQEAEDIQGRRVLTAYAHVAPLGWLVFVELPRAEAYAPLYSTIERSGILLLAALGFAFVAGPGARAQDGRPHPGAARRRRAHRQRRSHPAHLGRRPATSWRRSPTNSTTWREGCRNPMPTWRKRSSCAPMSSAQSVAELRALGEVSQAVNSTLDLQEVLNTIVAKAVQLSDTDAGAIYEYVDEPRRNSGCVPPTAWTKR